MRSGTSLKRSPVALFFPPSIATIPSIRLQTSRNCTHTATASNANRGHRPSPTPTRTAQAPSANTTLRREIIFALTPDLTSTRDNPPAHVEARDFKGLLPASSDVFSMSYVIKINIHLAMKILKIRPLFSAVLRFSHGLKHTNCITVFRYLAKATPSLSQAVRKCMDLCYSKVGLFSHSYTYITKLG